MEKKYLFFNWKVTYVAIVIFFLFIAGVITVSNSQSVHNSVTDTTTDICPKKDIECLRKVRAQTGSDADFELPHIIIHDGHVWTLKDKLAFSLYSDMGYINKNNEYSIKIAYARAEYFLEHMKEYQ